jgi:hypothetical protein
MGKPKAVDIWVHIENDLTQYPPNQYKFWLETDDNKIGKKKGDNLAFNNDGLYDGFDLTFKIKDKTGKGFRFMDDGKLSNGEPDPDLTPMWVKMVKEIKDGDCPDREFWPVFRTTGVSANNKELYVHNENPVDEPQLFKFALLFSTNPHRVPCEIMYDPGGDNQDGAKPFFSLKPVAIAAVGGAIVGALLTLTVQAIAN